MKSRPRTELCSGAGVHGCSGLELWYTFYVKNLESNKGPEEKIITQFERRIIVEKRLSSELKELFGNLVIVFNVATAIGGKSLRTEPLEQRADIVVQTKNDIDDVRKFLASESDFTIMKEGPGIVLTKDDTSFYLKLTEQKEKPPLSLDRLQILLNILDSIKMEGTKYMRDVEALKKSLMQGSTVPLVIEGDNGVRVSYDKQLGKLKVLFVRGFEKADNSRRKEVEDLIKQNFAEV